MQQRRCMRRFQLRLSRRQLHLHGRNNQRRTQLRNILHRHGLRYIQTEERGITPQKIHRKVYFLFGKSAPHFVLPSPRGEGGGTADG